LIPIGLDVLDELSVSGHLEPSVRAVMPIFDLLPTRHLKQDPELGALATTTFEWSEASRASKAFEVWQDATGPLPMDCIGMR
jgi:hypothetical protein